MLRLQLGLFAATAATSPVSIFAAQAFFGLGLGVYLLRLARGETTRSQLALDGPLLAFAVWTLLSAAFSPDPLASHQAAKKLVLFALFYLAVDSCTDRRAREGVVDAALLGTLALSLESLVQFFFLGYDSLSRRPQGFLGHYMTAAGVEATGLVLAAAYLAFFPRVARPQRRDLAPVALLVVAIVVLGLLERASPAVLPRRLFVAALGLAGAFLMLRVPAARGMAGPVLACATALFSTWALVLSQTRNAWLGAVFGLAAVIVFRAPRALWLLGAGLVVLLASRPERIVARLTFSDASSVDRYFMWQAGVDMVLDRPVFGQGPGMILRTYPSYRWEGAPNPQQPHLHDNLLQVAAERGLPALAFWVWMMAVLLGKALAEARAGGRRGFEGPAAFAVLTTLLVAGIFEYNFGDSEVLMFAL
ncbi:MAG TPA: O-antigen ligase family protein, partial [Vicinamibacteria bacterium]